MKKRKNGQMNENEEQNKKENVQKTNLYELRPFVWSLQIIISF